MVLECCCQVLGEFGIHDQAGEAVTDLGQLRITWGQPGQFIDDQLIEPVRLEKPFIATGRDHKPRGHRQGAFPGNPRQVGRLAAGIGCGGSGQILQGNHRRQVVPDHGRPQHRADVGVDRSRLLVEGGIALLRQVVQRLHQTAHFAEQLLVGAGDIGKGEGLAAVVQGLQLGQRAQGVAVAGEKRLEVAELDHVLARGVGQRGAAVTLGEHPQYSFHCSSPFTVPGCESVSDGWPVWFEVTLWAGVAQDSLSFSA